MTTPLRRRKRSDEMHTAYHEAGHAVLAEALGIRVKRVSIVADDESWGRVSLSYPSWIREVDWSLSAYREAILLRYITAKLGGATAIAIHNGRHVWRGTEHDRSSAADLALYITSDPDELNALLKWLRLRARKVLGAPQRWRAVEAVAAALLTERTLTGQQFKSILGDVRRACFDEGNKGTRVGTAMRRT